MNWDPSNGWVELTALIKIKLGQRLIRCLLSAQRIDIEFCFCPGACGRHLIDSIDATPMNGFMDHLRWYWI